MFKQLINKLPTKLKCGFLVGFIFFFLAEGTHYYFDSSNKKEAYIERQLFEFYYPMKNLLHDSQLYWEAYKARKVPRKYPEDAKDQWKITMLAIFRSQHQQLESVVSKKRHLSLDNDRLKKQLDQLMKHISEYKVIFKSWRDKRGKRLYARVSFPTKLQSYIEYDIKLLKSREK